jgi:hypothetical protein
MSSGLHNVGSTDIQKVRRNCQDAVNKMVRERDAGLPCISCAEFRNLDAGHFRSVGAAPNLRFHPWNINGQCRSDNGFKGGMTYEYGKELDARRGEGTADFLADLSRKSEPFSELELNTLKAAARMGPRVYEQVYAEMRPHHFPKKAA